MVWTSLNLTNPFFTFVIGALSNFLETCFPFVCLQVDVLESQFSQLMQQINSTRDFESIRLAHDHFLSNLLAQSFILLKPVLNYYADLCWSLLCW